VSRREIGLPAVDVVPALRVELRRLEFPRVELGPATAALAGLLLDLAEEPPTEARAPVVRANPHHVHREPLPHIDSAADAAAQEVPRVVNRIRCNRSGREVFRLEPPADCCRRRLVVRDETLRGLVLATLVRTELDAPRHVANVSHRHDVGQSDLAAGSRVRSAARRPDSAVGGSRQNVCPVHPTQRGASTAAKWPQPAW
jgi:hypothetical protein